MTENLFEAQYDITKKSKLKKFYESNKRVRINLSKGKVYEINDQK